MHEYKTGHGEIENFGLTSAVKPKHAYGYEFDGIAKKKPELKRGMRVWLDRNIMGCNLKPLILVIQSWVCMKVKLIGKR